jgi:Holliday junction resolvase RusA-like endonuclease
VIEIEIETDPTPWSPSRILRNGFTYNPKAKEKSWTQLAVKSAHPGAPIPGFVVVDMLFHEKIPKSTPKKTIPLMLSGEIRPTRCDTSNLCKFYEDCIKNILFQDDRFVVKNISEKVYGEKGKVNIKVYPLEEYRKLHENATRTG